MTRTTYSAPGAAAVGPYSHAVASGDLVYLSGQTPLDSRTGKLVDGDVAALPLGARVEIEMTARKG